jgi:hypothetical protein
MFQLLLQLLHPIFEELSLLIDLLVGGLELAVVYRVLLFDQRLEETDE